MSDAAACKICGWATVAIGTKRRFHLRHCEKCRFSFVANPCLEYERLYSDAYYRGEGADPLVDYVYELEHPEETIRNYEWRGIVESVGALVPLHTGLRWLDFGCGNGGLVRHCRELGIDAAGFEEGAIAGRVTIPLVAREDLAGLERAFDVVTAIEVLEHVECPLDILRQIRRLLKPGGLFFYTTGNAEPYRGRLTEWGYVAPEIHISFFEPATLYEALRRAGFRPEQRGFLPGFTEIIRFKVLKNTRCRRRSWWEKCLPWPVIARAVDGRLRISAHPIAWSDG